MIIHYPYCVAHWTTLLALYMWTSPCNLSMNPECFLYESRIISAPCTDGECTHTHISRMWSHSWSNAITSPVFLILNLIYSNVTLTSLSWHYADVVWQKFYQIWVSLYKVLYFCHYMTWLLWIYYLMYTDCLCKYIS